MTLSYAEHKRAAAELIEACGGPVRAADQCRVEVPALSRYQSKTSEDGKVYYMPADVIADLEAKAGRPIYSAMLLDSVKHEPGFFEDIGAATCSVNEEMSDLQRAVRVAMADHQLTPFERTMLLTAIDRIVGDLTKLRDTVRAEEPSAMPRFA